MQKVYEDAAPKKTAIYEWISRFKDGREGVKDDHRNFNHSTSINEENVNAVRSMIVTVQVTAKAVEILTDNLGAFSSLGA